MVAILTGDIVNSTNIQDRGFLNDLLKESFGVVEQGDDDSFEIFRGDSFQGMLSDASGALRAAIIIRSRLRAWDSSMDHVLVDLPDARIGIGVGEVSYRADSIVESDGQAYQYSGSLIDEMKKNHRRITVKTPWEEVNKELLVTCALVDATIDRWTSPMAEAAYLYFSEELTQKELSERLCISQPAVHKRLSSASVDAIEMAVKRFDELMNQYIG